MLEIVSGFPGTPKERIVRMSEMEPLQVGQVVSGGEYDGHFVMRTAHRSNVEVMDLTRPGVNRSWGEYGTLKVRLLRPDESVYIKVANDE